MRVLFWYRGIESLGIGYLMSMLQHHGHEVDLLFEPGLDDNNYLRVPALAALNRREALIERARAFDPDLVCVGSVTNIWSYAAEMAKRLKEELGVPILVGGHHAQALPEYVLSQPYVDMVCTGEGELALLELVDRMERGADITTTHTMWIKQDGVIHRNEIGPLEEDLDRLPFPEKQLWRDYGAFKDNLEVFTGRGCPFKCTFCNIHYQREIFDGKGDFLRKRSVENVMQELEQNLARWDAKYVSVHDDNFTTGVLWVEEFCEVYRERIGLPWFCFGYPTTLKPRLLRAMKAANCETIFMGVDSGDAEVRKVLMERPMTDELIRDKTQLLKDHGINQFFSTVYGSPGETAEQMWKTFDMVGDLRPTQCSGNVFYPLPKTKLHDLAVEMGYLDEAGVQMVRDGASSFHQESLLDHPDKDLAEMLARVTPMYVKAPDWARPALKWMVRRRTKRAALALYVALIPVTMRHVGKEAVRITASMTWKAITLKRRQPKWGPKVPRPAAQREGVVTMPPTDTTEPETVVPVPVVLGSPRTASS